MSEVIVRSKVGATCRSLNLYYSAQSLRDFYSHANHRDLRSLEYYYLFDELVSSYSARLDNNYVISPTSDELRLLRDAREYKRGIVAAARVKMRRDGKYVVDKDRGFSSVVYARFRERALSARRCEHIARLVWELEESNMNGWFPVFVTLTVAPEHYEEVFARGSSAFKDYIRKVTRRVGFRLGMNKRESDAAGGDIHRYFGVGS
jgi:hypothetical protein